ncbi:hypothetical protein LTA6_000803 [Microbacterium sp. LTA6]
MDALDVLGSIADIIAWIGLGIGIPLLLVVAIGRAHDGRWHPIEVVILEEAERARARWYTAGDFWERPLRASEAEHWRGREEAPAFISEKHPRVMSFEPRRPALHAIQVVAIALASAGGAGLVLSFVLLFVA